MKVSPRPALLLTRREIAALMTPEDYLAAVKEGFRRSADEDAHAPMPMHIAVPEGAFHVKGAHAVLDRSYVAVKLNGYFPGNPQRRGLPTIQGVILLCDVSDGSVLRGMDATEITLRRTAAASALAAGNRVLENVHAELGDLVVGRKSGRTRPDEITVFDSTGTALQDVASAAAIYQRAIAGNIGLSINFGALS